MTLQESLGFNISLPKSDAEWRTFEKIQPGVGYVHLGPYHFRFLSTAQHQFHCLQKMSEALSIPRRSKQPIIHFEHCLEYLRQTYICSADAFLEEGDFMTRNFSVERVQDTRKCRNWQPLITFTNENFEDWKRFNGVHNLRP